VARPSEAELRRGEAVAWGAPPGMAAALDYASRGWPVSPWGTRGNRKFPLTSHGHLDATTDRRIVEQWWARWPSAVSAVATGEPSGIVGLDIDVRPTGSGFESLGEFGIFFHPAAPTAHTPQDGCAVLFRWPGYFVKTCSGKLAPGRRLNTVARSVAWQATARGEASPSRGTGRRPTLIDRSVVRTKIGGAFVFPPSAPLIGRDGVVRKQDGKPQYEPSSRGRRRPAGASLRRSSSSSRRAIRSCSEARHERP
jgi:Bifunctional DNA primase/polymerase, N-terminal